MPELLPRQLAPLSNAQELDPGQQAYDRCLEAESQESAEDRLVPLRLLGWMLQKAPSVEVRSIISREILSAPQDTSFHDLHQLGQLYIEHYVRIFKAAKGRTPYETHPSRPSVDTLATEINNKLLKAPTSHHTAKMQALYRDGYRCMVTGQYDSKFLSNSDIKQKFLELDKPACFTNCCHILSPTITGKQDHSSSTDSTLQEQYASNAWATLLRFGGLGKVKNELLDMLNSSNVHKLYNILTMSQPIHSLFDNLELWFEETDTSHSYRIRTPGYDDAFRKLCSIPDVVTFTSPDPDSLPLPESRILKLHATCAEVAHLSGAAEYISTTLDSIDEGVISVLAEDGSSSALQMAMARQNIFVH